jgi:hypothetical protein
MNNPEHVAAFIEECEKRGLRVVSGPEILDLGAGPENLDVEVRYAEGRVEGMYTESENEGWIDAIYEAISATRVRFGLPPSDPRPPPAIVVEPSTGRVYTTGDYPRTTTARRDEP